MNSSIYVTFDNTTSETGAGLVCLHELEALKRVSNLRQVISRENLTPLGHYDFNPFLADYFAAELIKEPVEIAHLSCSPGNAITSKLGEKAKVLVNMPAHDLKLSVDEHERIYGAGSYPFVHNTDPYLWNLLTKHTRERANIIITPSTKSAEWIEKTLKPKGRIEIIPHGTNIPEKTAPLPEQFTAGYLGAGGVDKGLIYLIMAWSSLNYPESEFLFAGDCSQEVKHYIQGLAKSGGKFRVGGRVGEPRNLYDACSVYVQPSVSEGWGMEVPEAMACGRPVIVSEGAGSADCVDDGGDGFLVPIRDPKAIADKIRYFDENPKELTIMGQRARKKAQKYSWENVEGQYRELYSSL